MVLALTVLLPVCIALSVILSGMEAGVFAVNRLRVRQKARAGDPRAKVLQVFLDNPEDFLWTILVGNTLANIGIFGVGVTALYRALWPWPVVLVGALAAAVLLFFALCELGPKMVFRVYPNRLCLGLALPFRLLHVLLKPVVGPMALLAGSWLKLSGGRRFTGSLFASREELRLLMQESGRGLSNEERAMINRVLELQKLKLAQVAVPMGKVAGVSMDAPVHEVLALARETGFSRFPVWGPGPARRTAGLVTVASLVFREEADESHPVREFMKPALFLDGELRVEAALRQMQRTGNRLVMVLAPDRSEVGVVGWSDLLKAIFGEVSL